MRDPQIDVAGQPRGWLSLQEAISAYARNDVIYGIGDLPVFGGIQRLTGVRSSLTCAHYRTRWPCI